MFFYKKLGQLLVLDHAELLVVLALEAGLRGGAGGFRQPFLLPAELFQTFVERGDGPALAEAGGDSDLLRLHEVIAVGIEPAVQAELRIHRMRAQVHLPSLQQFFPAHRTVSIEVQQ